jgi:hypothetical protein
MITSDVSRGKRMREERTCAAAPERLALLLFVVVALAVLCVLPAVASAAITYVGSSTNNANGGTLTVTAPAGDVGDFLLAQFAYGGGTSAAIICRRAPDILGS